MPEASKEMQQYTFHEAPMQVHHNAPSVQKQSLQRQKRNTPAKMPEKQNDLREEFARRLREKNDRYHAVITMERSYVASAAE